MRLYAVGSGEGYEDMDEATWIGGAQTVGDLGARKNRTVENLMPMPDVDTLKGDLSSYQIGYVEDEKIL